MKRIFLTGATGVMGSRGLRELIKFPDLYEISVLARDSRKNRKRLAPYAKKGVKLIWGDLLDSDAVKRGVENADIVLHVGGMVSPTADWYPQLTVKTNVGSMQNIIAAASSRKDDIKIVYIGSVSQYGPHKIPNHWGECGDQLFPAAFDAYAYSKIESERLLIDSDIRQWVSLRQTGILHSGLLMKASDPITFHVPIDGVLEWVTAEDSGRLLERICRDSVPDSFWGKCYNIGGGEPYRLTNYEFERKLLETMGCPRLEKIFEPRWFATGNFHGIWFKDSDLLEEILHFRSGQTPDEYFLQMKKELPWYFSLAPLVPAFIIKKFMEKVTKAPVLGPIWWIKHNVEPRINAAWGSREAWESIKSWKDLHLHQPCKLWQMKEDSHQPENFAPEEEGNMIRSHICPKCGHEYTMKVRTYVAGHRCPKCLKNSLISSI